MFYRISNVLKKILIQELQDLFKDHPFFGDNLVITNKFQHKERPKYAIVIKAASGNSLKLGLDNFKGMIESYVTLANLKNQYGRAIEWVREDLENVANLVKPGYYIIRMTDVSKDNVGQFVVEPYLTVADELLEIKHEGFNKVYLQHNNINPSSDYILSENGQILRRNDHYTINYNNGEVTFLKPIDDFGQLTADYQYIGAQTGPFEVEVETANNVAIPGVVLAFGDQFKKDAVQVVVVYPSRQEVAKAYIGKWNMRLDISAYAQDTDTQEQLVDLTSMFLWSVLQEKLVNEGIYLDNFALSGESEEDEEKASDELAYLGGLSFDVSVEWEVHQPVLGVIKKIFLNRIEDFGQYDNTELAIRSQRVVGIEQRGVDYKVGLQITESFEPYVVRPVKKYTLYIPNGG